MALPKAVLRLPQRSGKTKRYVISNHAQDLQPSDMFAVLREEGET